MFKHLLIATLSLALTTQAAAARGFATAPAARQEERIGHRNDDRARLRKVLAARRAKNLAAFRAYVRAGAYPHNQLTPGELNVWIDVDGNKCAAATMIWASGAHDLVTQVAADDNLIRLANVTEGPLLDWIVTSGLTHDEVVLIQRPFIGRPGGPPRPLPGRPLADWRIAADRALRAKYDAILRELERSRVASLDAALDALVAHPDLVASLLRR